MTAAMQTLWDKYGIVPGRGVCVFDPVTLTASTMAMTAAGGAISAASTLAGGSYAQQAGVLQQQEANREATQIEMNAAQSFAAGQRRALDTAQRTRLAVSSAKARAGASGVDAGVGSPVSTIGDLEQRGSYQALMDLFNGESEATGLRNKADAVRFGGDIALAEGEAKKKASRMAALGTLAGTAGSMFKTYGAFKYPASSGRASF